MTTLPANFPRKQLKARARYRRTPDELKYMGRVIYDPPMVPVGDQEATAFYDQLMSGAFEEPSVAPSGLVDVEMSHSGDVVMSSNTRREYDEL